MNEAPAIFDFQEQPVRVVSRGEEPWFVASDVCRVLGIANSRDAVGALEDDEKITVANTDGNPRAGVPHSYTLIAESGLYALVFKSRKPQAKAFRKWVTAEVLPAIRKKGSYQAVSVDATLEMDTSYDSVHTFGLVHDMYFDELAAFARFVKSQANAREMEHVRRYLPRVGTIRIYPVEFLREQVKVWAREASPPRYRKRHEHSRLRLPDSL